VDLLGGIRVSPNWNFEDIEDGGHRVPFEDAGFTIRQSNLGIPLVVRTVI
jgi:hypothetical protein